MDQFYVYCAAIAGTFLVGQFVLNLLGLAHDSHFDALSGDHGDIDLAHEGIDGAHDAHDTFDHAGQWWVGMLSFRALVAGLTVFGLSGIAASRHFSHAQTFLIALAAGGGMLYLMAWLMRMMYRLRADGTVRLERAVGYEGTVYLTVPGGNAGTGKVTLVIQGRSMEFPAVTSGEALPTGAKVVVRRVIGVASVEVARAGSIPEPHTLRAAAVEGETHVPA